MEGCSERGFEGWSLKRKNPTFVGWGFGEAAMDCSE
ncbi:MAG: hypothetical protein JWR14_6959 [Caballeronia sp.]|jgi:hypothetical protein|nr:hypothetical protein [Caballeronia sp.]